MVICCSSSAAPVRRSVTSRRWSSAAALKCIWTACRPLFRRSAVPSSEGLCAAPCAPSSTGWSSVWRRRCCPSFQRRRSTCWRTASPKTCRSSSRSSVRSPPSLRYRAAGLIRINQFTVNAAPHKLSLYIWSEFGSVKRAFGNAKPVCLVRINKREV